LTTVYHYPKCSTCRKALQWLDSHGVEYRSIDITQQPPSRRQLKQALGSLGGRLPKLFNTSGQVYRQEGYKEKLKTLTEAQALSALAANGKLIKRPLVLGDGWALVGFNEADYAERFG
jgi:arsenate reductase (glutaredoxin)